MRSISICKTPSLGGTLYVCKDCGVTHRVYKSCGNSHCMICQSKKRLDWQVKISNRLYEVAYAHITFTLPSELRLATKANPKVFLNILFKSSWETLKELSSEKENVGALPGMVGVLHTFGSDLSYHPHVHCLVTYGGFDENNNWVNPKRKRKIAKYRKLSKRYRKIFLNHLEKAYKKGQIDYHLDYAELTEGLDKKRWVVNHQPPVLDTERIENYLSKYVCRTAVTPQRVKYDGKKQLVELLHKKYKKQKKGKAAPLEIKKMSPLVAIDMIMQHKLPQGFHRTRYYGIHSTTTSKRIRPLIKSSYLRAKKTIKQIFAIIRIVEYLLGLPDSSIYRCKDCESENIESYPIYADAGWASQNIKGFKLPRPPTFSLENIPREKSKADFV